MFPQRNQMSNIFEPSSPIISGFHVLLNYPYINIVLFQKNVWMRHCSGATGSGTVRVLLLWKVGEGGGFVWKGKDKYPLWTMFKVKKIENIDFRF